MSWCGDRIKARQTGVNSAPNALAIGVVFAVHTATSSYVNGPHAMTTTDLKRSMIHGTSACVRALQPVNKTSILCGTDVTMISEAIAFHRG